MARRTGLITLRNLAGRICKVYPVWAGAIKRAYPGNTALQAALDAAVAACAVLVEEVEEVRSYET